MKQELDKLLCKDYPKLFVNRNADMQTTCMCWGFECGDGWYNILHQLCESIQCHIDWVEKSNSDITEYNQMIEDSKSGNWVRFEEYYRGWDPILYKKRRNEIGWEKHRELRDPCPQVVVSQVKEKFGTLCFYYSGGDDIIDGMVRMAEAMSSVTCEECGSPGKRRGGGWIYVACDIHRGVIG